MFRTKKLDGVSLEGIFSLDFPSDTTLNKAENISKGRPSVCDISLFRTNKLEHLPLASFVLLYLTCEFTKVRKHTKYMLPYHISYQRVADSFNSKLFNMQGSFCHSITALNSSLMLIICLYKHFQPSVINLSQGLIIMEHLSLT